MFHEITQSLPVLFTVAVVTGCGAPDTVGDALTSDLSDGLETVRQARVDCGGAPR
jgi:hypothetical protein